MPLRCVLTHGPPEKVWLPSASPKTPSNMALCCFGREAHVQSARLLSPHALPWPALRTEAPSAAMGRAHRRPRIRGKAAAVGQQRRQCRSGGRGAATAQSSCARLGEEEPKAEVPGPRYDLRLNPFVIPCPPCKIVVLPK